MRLMLAFVLLCSVAVGGEAKGNSSTDEKVKQAISDTMARIPIAIKQRADLSVSESNPNFPFTFRIKYWVEQFSIEQVKIDCDKIAEVCLSAVQKSGINKQFIFVYAGYFFPGVDGEEMGKAYGHTRYNAFKDEFSFVRGWE